MVKTIEELFGDVPAITPKFNESVLRNTEHVEGYFDEDDDSLALFYDDSAKRGIYVPLTGGYHVIVHPDSHEVVGIYVEGWVKDYVNQIPVLQEMWANVTTSEPVEAAPSVQPAPIREPLPSFWQALFAFLLTFVLRPNPDWRTPHSLGATGA